jgi:ribosomal protein L37AE/L43A
MHDSEQRAKCERNIRPSVRQAVEMVEDYVNPAHVCKPLCPETALQDPKREELDWKCPFCEFIATQAEVALRNTTTDREVLKVLTNECKRLPQEFVEHCIEYVHTEGAALLQLVRVWWTLTCTACLE